MNMFEKLRAPFREDEVEWRIQSSGYHQSNGPWARVLCYIQNRAVQNRLDEVVGPQNWCNRFTVGPSGGVMCGLTINIDNDWITKWDGAENTDIESVKGGLSDAMKRAAVMWGIGRYLYGLGDSWANFNVHGKYSAKIDGEYYKWNPPRLPDWALPQENRPKDPNRVQNGKIAILESLESNSQLFSDSYLEMKKMDCEACETEEQVETLYKQVRADIKGATQEERKE